LNSPIVFATGGENADDEKMRITAAGDVKIATDKAGGIVELSVTNTDIAADSDARLVIATGTPPIPHNWSQLTQPTVFAEMCTHRTHQANHNDNTCHPQQLTMVLAMRTSCWT
jgi:hypothetical protein